ncbi:hypothetical protein [Burkholderia cepacia]|nr:MULTISPECIES: hypothetical protein [Burkholderia cepacia complex]
MDSDRASLRSLVDKWLGGTPANPVRMTQFGRTTNGVRFVSMEVPRLSGPLTIAFFYHEDGAWRVFPPSPSLLGIAPTSRTKRVGERAGLSYQVVQSIT